MRKIIVLFSLLAGCATQSMMFGGEVVGPYYKHFDDELECAVVDGWYPESKCMCHIPDPNFSVNKSFLWAENYMCQEKLPEGFETNDYSI